MTCHPLRIAGGPGVVCIRGARKPRCNCGRPATLECDGPSNRPSGTCDRRLCEHCSTQTPGKDGDTHDLCYRCVARAPKLEAKAREDAWKAKQGDLFNGGDK